MATGAAEGYGLAPSAPPSSWPPAYQWPGHQYQSQYQSIPGPEMPYSPAFNPEAEPAPTPVAIPPAEPAFTNASLPWRPFYLRRFVLASFALTFALVLVAIEVLLALSNQNHGIGTGHSGQHYLWTYGPTAFLTLVAALWGRTEYQSKLAIPWIRLSRQPTRPDQALLLDYLSDFQPYSVFKALRNKDFIVAITATVSIIIKILIIISTGLITLSRTAVTHESYAMVAQDRFVADAARLTQANSLPWYMMKGLAGRNLTYTDGINEDYAFQSVHRAGLPESAETRATVDGITNTLDCEAAEVVLIDAAPIDPRYVNTRFNFTITSPSCNIQHQSLPSAQWSCNGKADNCTQLFARFDTVFCDGTDSDSEDGRRMFVIFGNFTWAKDYSHNYTDYTGQGVRYDYFSTLHQSAQLLCKPAYTYGKVDVVRNGTDTLRITPTSASINGTLGGIGAWDIWDAHVMSTKNPIVQKNGYGVFGHSINISDAYISVDANTDYALESQFKPGAGVASLFQPASLRELVTGYYRQSAAIVARTTLMEPGSAEIAGSVVVEEDRLVVRTWAAQWMAGLVAACLVLTATGLFLVPRCGILPASPSTIPAMATLIANSHELTARLRLLGSADGKTIRHTLQGSAFKSGVVHDPATNQVRFAILDTRSNSLGGDRNFPQIRALQAHPAIVHPVTRITLGLVLAGLIVALELMLRKSDSESGLGDVGDDTFIHYTWTAIPALAFGTLAMIVSAMDFRVRCLAPYTALTRSVSADRLMALEFLDMSIPRIIYKELRFANIGALATTLAFLITSLFTIFSASLFHPESLPGEGSLTLQANQSLSPRLLEKEDALLSASLIFAANATFPRFTYENLAFIDLIPSTVSMPANTHFDPSTVSVEAVVPAVRGRMDCRSYNEAQIRTNLTRNYTEIYIHNPLGVLIEGEGCGRNSSSSRGPVIHDGWLTTFPNMTYFGAASQSNDGGLLEIRGCSDHVYIWGKIDYTATPSVQHIAAMGCNVSYEAVDVDTAFIGTSLQIDPRNPPRPREDTVRDSAIPRLIPTANTGDINFQDLIYYYLAGIPVGTDLLSRFFAMLTSSRWAIPRSHLGDPAFDDTVREAIKFHHGIIQAQVLGFNRQPANVSNATLANPQPGDNEAGIVLNATVFEAEARRRVMQDAVSTRILQALLGATLALLLAGWGLMRHTAVLASSPTTIAAQTALVAGGNMLETLPPGAEWRGKGEIEAALGKKTRFWMGWRTVSDEEGKAVGGENEGGVSRFGIFAIREGEGMGAQQTAYQWGGEYVQVANGEWQKGQVSVMAQEQWR